MLFNTFNYLFLLLSSVILYYLFPLKQGRLVLLFFSLFFYWYAGPLMIPILLAVIIVSYISGVFIDKNQEKKAAGYFYNIGVVLLIGVLVVFKYQHFLLGNIQYLLDKLGIVIIIKELPLFAPLGISYYIFQSISYLTDIRRGELKAERNFFAFSLYMSFFPKLLMGPIERGRNLLPQLNLKPVFDSALIAEGLKQMLWGYFKKLVVADRLSLYTSVVLNNHEMHTGKSILVATVFYTFQLYADFSGYTDIALGSAKLFGIRLTDNFNLPFFSRSITEFWRRWHISLSTWLTDYLYTPFVIKFRNWGQVGVISVVLLTFIICGIWHGAAWTFLFFGLLHGLALSYEIITKKVRKKIAKKAPKLFYNSFSIFFTFLFFSFTLIFFKANSIMDAIAVIRQMTNLTGGIFYSSTILADCAIAVFFLMVVEFKKEFLPGRLLLFSNNRWYIRYLAYSFVLILILMIGVFDGGQFIYFKF
jgi:alginate O-acetyltransferase complex protein AlgI